MPDTFDRLKAALADRYAIERELGSGGMATVNLAEDLKLHRKVAVKVLRPDLAATLGPERFLREIEVAAQLHHPHILPLHDSGEADGFLYYVMPYEEGQSLREKLAKEGELPVTEAVRLLRDVVDALAHAHKQGVVHRDIKPDNVMLSGRHALVTDFGVAKAVSEATGRQQLTTAGVALGTPAYMAPEQAVADPHIDHRADIYAVGALAYELLTGQPPFTGTTPQMVLSAHVTEAPEPVTKYRETVPPALAQLVMKCLEKKPADRWQSAEELLPQLEALATPSGGVTPTDTLPVTAAAPRSRKIAVGVVAAALVIAAAAVAVFRPERGAALVPNRVVVAALENETGDPTLDPVGKMAGDWITQGLQQAGIVEVIAWPTALQSSRYVQSEMEAGKVRDPVQALAEETGAGTVISGAYYREGETIRFQVQVTDAEGGQLLGALDPVSGTVESPVEAIERLRERVLGFLAVSFDERLAASAQLQSQAPTLEAYRAYHDGMELYIKGEQTDAIRHFYRAAVLDSTFIIPLIYAAYCHYNLRNGPQVDSLLTIVNEHRDELPAYERYMADAMRAGNRGERLESYRAYRSAGELAPGSKAVYNYAFAAQQLNRPQEAIDVLGQLDPERGAMRGWVGYWNVMSGAYHMLGDHRQELETAGRARQQYPNQLFPLWNEVAALAALGRVEEINERLDHAATLPKEWSVTPGVVMTVVAEELRAHGYPEAARDVLDRALRWFESRPSAEVTTESHRGALGSALYNAERWEEAGTLLEKLAEDFPDNFFYRGALGLIAARRGDRAAADSISAWLAELDRPYGAGVRTFLRAGIAAVLGEQERAVALLQDAFAQGLSYDPQIQRFIDFESLRDYPPFQELLRPKG